MADEAHQQTESALQKQTLEVGHVNAAKQQCSSRPLGSGPVRSGPVRSGTVRGPVRGGMVRGPVRSRKPTVVGLN